MAKRDLEQLEEQVKSQHKYWENLSVEDRRALIIQMRNKPTKDATKNVFSIVIIGLLFFAGTILFWVNEFKLSTTSNLGVVSGVVLATLAFRYTQSNRITSRDKLLSNDFTDADVLAYFEEHERINQKALKQWNTRGKYVVYIFFGTLILLLNIRFTFQFSIMVLFSGVSVFLCGLAVFTFFQKANQKNVK